MRGPGGGEFIRDWPGRSLTGAIYAGQIANNRMTELCSVPNITAVLMKPSSRATMSAAMRWAAGLACTSETRWASSGVTVRWFGRQELVPDSLVTTTKSFGDRRAIAVAKLDQLTQPSPSADGVLKPSFRQPKTALGAERRGA